MKKFLIFSLFGFAFLVMGSFSHVVYAADNFVPLTSLPGVSDIAKSDNLPAFFNALYKICVGVAATIAVLQIMRAGIMYMGGDSVTETKQAREIIQNAVLGLVLVLSPFIIFSIINPSLLNLSIGLNGLQPDTVTTSPAATQTSPDGTVSKPIFACPSTTAQDDCTKAGGAAVRICFVASSNGALPFNGKDCPQGEAAYSCSVQAPGCTPAQQVISFGTNASCPTSFTSGQQIPGGCEKNCTGPNFKIQVMGVGSHAYSACVAVTPAGVAACPVLTKGGHQGVTQACCLAQSPRCYISNYSNKNGPQTQCACN